MQDFKRTLVVCAAASVFGIGAFTGFSGVTQIGSDFVKNAVQKVNSAAVKAEVDSTSAVTGEVSALLRGARKRLANALD